MHWGTHYSPFWKLPWLPRSWSWPGSWSGPRSGHRALRQLPFLLLLCLKQQSYAVMNLILSHWNINILSIYLFRFWSATFGCCHLLVYLSPKSKKMKIEIILFFQFDPFPNRYHLVPLLKMHIYIYLISIEN